MEKQYIVIKNRPFSDEYMKVVNTSESVCYCWVDSIEQATTFNSREKAMDASKVSGFNAIPGVSILEV